MKLAMFVVGEGAHLGALSGDTLIDVTAAGGPASLLDVVKEGEAGMIRARDTVERASATSHMMPVDKVTFLPPIPNPDKFLCVGKNYRDHLEELVRTNLIKEIPTEPTGFIKLNSVMVGHDAKVKRPQGIVEFDYEPELVFIIGKPGYRVSKAEAMDHVFGITVFNDLTAREIQKREVQMGTRFWTAKNMPGFGPIGPVVATMDEIADVNDLWLTCTVNGHQRSRFNTSGQIFKIPDIIEHFSRYIPLQPGDLFATGSAGGIAAAQENPAQLYLKPGDVIDIAIEDVVSLRTHIVE
jgi:2-keto-4-pentenoate hydratase/2-oxohepta-3-ene-1,7-dioic acid hydratase in catechol pathway